MEIVKLEDINITVKTVTINGRKMAKTYFPQIPFEIFVYHKRNSRNMLGYRDDADSLFNGSFLGWINQSCGTYHQIRSLIERFNCDGYDYLNLNIDTNPIRYYPILFLDKDGNLRRSIIDEISIDLLNIRKQQVYL